MPLSSWPLLWSSVLAIGCLLIVAGCVTQSAPDLSGQPAAVVIVEDWEPLVEATASSYLEAVTRDADRYGETGGESAAIIGCFAAAVGITAAGATTGHEVVCMVGGAALYPLGYALGYGAGAVVGAVRGAFAGPAEGTQEVDMAALVAALADSRPADELEAALRVAAAAPFTRITAAPSDGDYGALAREGFARVIVLRIKALYVATAGFSAPTSRLNLAVEGAVIESATGDTLSSPRWGHRGAAFALADLAGDERDGLYRHVAVAWTELAAEIAADVLD